jgi:2-methylcitrate dehydratase PrpD
VLRDGRETTHVCQSPRGDFENPYSETELRQKFRYLAGRIVSEEGANALEQTIDRAESWDSMSELVSVFHRHRS